MNNRGIERIIKTAMLHKRSQNDNLIENFIKGKANLLGEVLKRHREVRLESMKKIAEIRFQIKEERLLIGRIDDEHDIGRIILSHFINKFPTFYIIIFSNNGLQYGSKKIRIDVKPTGESEGEIINYFREELKKLNLKTIKIDNFNAKMWEEYYDSQYIPERKNISAQNKCITLPENNKRMRIYLKKKENKNLNEY